MVARGGAAGKPRPADWRYSASATVAGAPFVSKEERRKEEARIPEALKAELNPDQKETLGELEKFGWELRFVRHDPEQRPVPVIFDAEREKFAVLDPEGNLDENAFINIR
jgi:phosphoglycolate phosphatase-like HAD superfamily hydrolase